MGGTLWLLKSQNKDTFYHMMLSRVLIIRSPGRPDDVLLSRPGRQESDSDIPQSW